MAFCYFCRTMRGAFRFSVFLLIFIGMHTAVLAQRGVNRPLKKDLLLLDLGYSGLSNAPTGVRYRFGYGFNGQFLFDFKLWSERMSWAVGFGYSNQRYYGNAYHLHKDTVLGDFTQVLPISDSSYKRNMYITNYLDFPFEIRYRSKPNSRGHSWKISAGMRVGVKLGSHTKTVTKGGKYADFIHPNLTKTRVGLTGRVGYGRLGAYYYYGLTRLFEPGRGHELIPFEVGITVSPF